MRKEREYWCKSLCELSRLEILCAYDGALEDFLLSILFAPNGECKVLYDPKLGLYHSATFVLCDTAGIRTELRTCESGINGYVDGGLIYDVPLPFYVVDHIDDLAMKYWRESYDENKISDIEEDEAGFVCGKLEPLKIPKRNKTVELCEEDENS